MTVTEQPRTTSAPVRTREQMMAALKQANVVRTRRATIKKALASGHLTPATVLFAMGHDWLLAMRVETVLLATPKLGRAKVARTLNACRISPSKTIQGLSERQGRELFDYLQEHYPHADIGPPSPIGSRE